MNCYHTNILRLSYRSFHSSTRCSQKAVPLAYNTASPKNPDDKLKPLLIFHGLFGSKINWKSMSSQFAQRTGREIFALDLRNHGDSPHTPNDEATIQLMSDDIKLFMDDKGFKQAALLGHR